MKKGLFHALTLIVLAAVVAGGCFLWMRRPWRPAVKVNGHVLSAGELGLRAQTLSDDAGRTGNPAESHDFEGGAWEHYRRRAAKLWIVKEVLLAEALARGYTVSAADEKDSLVQTAARLKTRNLTVDRFFKEGPIPEEIKRRDYREGVLINKFVTDALRGGRFNEGFRNLFRELYAKAEVKCPEFPELEALDVVAPPRKEH